MDTENIEVSFKFSIKDYIMIHGKDDRFPGSDLMVWTLNYLIDRSHKGKDPDIGVPVLYLTEVEATELRDKGFARLYDPD